MEPKVGAISQTARDTSTPLWLQQERRRSPADGKIAMSPPQRSTTCNRKTHTLSSLKSHKNPLFYLLPRLKIYWQCEAWALTSLAISRSCVVIIWIGLLCLSGCYCTVKLPEYLLLAPRSEMASKADFYNSSISCGNPPRPETFHTSERAGKPLHRSRLWRLCPSVGASLMGMHTSEQDTSRYVMRHNASPRMNPPPAAARPHATDPAPRLNRCSINNGRFGATHLPGAQSGKRWLDEGGMWRLNEPARGEERRGQRMGKGPEAWVTTARWIGHGRRSSRTNELGDEVSFLSHLLRTVWRKKKCLCWFDQHQGDLYPMKRGIKSGTQREGLRLDARRSCFSEKDVILKRNDVRRIQGWAAVLVSFTLSSSWNCRRSNLIRGSTPLST